MKYNNSIDNNNRMLMGIYEYYLDIIKRDKEYLLKRKNENIQLKYSMEKLQKNRFTQKERLQLERHFTLTLEREILELRCDRVNILKHKLKTFVKSKREFIYKMKYKNVSKYKYKMKNPYKYPKY